MSDQYVVIAEIGLTKSSYGAEIRVSDPMSRQQAQTFLEQMLRGGEADFYQPSAGARIFTTDGNGQTLIVENHRLRPESLTRLTIAACRT